MLTRFFICSCCKDLLFLQTGFNTLIVMAAKVRDQVEEELVDIVEGEAGEGLSVEELISKNQNLILVGLGVIILLLGGWFFYRTLQQGQNEEAHAEMFRAIKYFEADSLNKALNGDGQYLGLLDVAEDYSGTGAANMANYYIGVIHAKQSDLNSAVEYLEKVNTSDDMLSMATFMALGFAYEDLGDAGKAASYFEKAAATPDENESTTPTMLLHAGRNYEAAGQTGKALEVYQQIKDDYPLSSEGINIDKYIGRVSQ